MSKGVVIGILALFALGGLALSWIEVDAGCCCNPRVCASYIKGSGSPVGLVTGQGFDATANELACPGVVATSGGYGGYGEEPFASLQSNGPPAVTSVALRIVGTEGTDCGLDPSDNDACDVKVVVDCGGVVNKKATTPGPLTINAGNFGQSNNGSGPDSANFTFQLSDEAKLDLCPDGNFVDFFVREGFFETCVNGTLCVQDSCKADMGGGQSDARPYHCNPV